MSAPIVIRSERPRDGPAVAALIDRAFGPGRFAKAAERLREGNAPNLGLCQVAWKAGAVVGCARVWPVRIGETDALLLGPFAVDPAERRAGLGARLVRAACHAASAAGVGPVILVGDLPYFAPLGFSAAREVVLPGPVDRARVLVFGDAALAGQATVRAEQR